MSSTQVDQDYQEGQATSMNDAEPDQTSEWLKKNKLNHLIKKFKEVRIEIDELIDLTNENDEFLDSLIASNTITSTDKIRIKRAVRLMNKSQNINDKQKIKVVTVLISDQEEVVMNKLNKQKQTVILLIDKFKKYQAEIDENTEKCKNKIDGKFKNIFVRLENEKQNITNALYSISQQKKLEIITKSQKLQDTKMKFDAVLNSCNQLIQNCNIDRFKRKQKILSLCNDVINQQIPNNDGIDTQIIFEFDDDSVSQFLSGLCAVYGKEHHPLPVVRDVKVHSIGSNAATISWNAKLLVSKKNEKKRIDSKLFVKVECMNNEFDEKEKDALGSDFIEFDKNKQNYTYRYTNLKPLSKYKMILKIFESKSFQSDPKQSQQRTDFKSRNISFKTLSVIQWKWVAEISPTKRKNYQCCYDVSNNGKTLQKARMFTTIDIVRMNPWISKKTNNRQVLKLYLSVEQHSGVNVGQYDLYGFGVITKQRWNTDTAWWLGIKTNPSYWWKFKGGIFLGEDKKDDMPPISSVGQMIGLEIDFRSYTVTFKLFSDTNVNNMIGSSVGRFDAMNNEEICVVIAVEKASKFTIVYP